MKVALAAQLLSETTSKSPEYFRKKWSLQEKRRENTRQFNALAGKRYDLFKSRVQHDIKPSRKAYGLSLDNQYKVLQDMMHTAKAMSL